MALRDYLFLDADGIDANGVKWHSVTANDRDAARDCLICDIPIEQGEDIHRTADGDCVCDACVVIIYDD